MIGRRTVRIATIWGVLFACVPALGRCFPGPLDITADATTNDTTATDGVALSDTESDGTSELPDVTTSRDAKDATAAETTDDALLPDAAACAQDEQCPDESECRVGFCDHADGVCKVKDADDGKPCDDDDACTVAETCRKGGCAGTRVTCEAADQCHFDVICDPETGKCPTLERPNGHPCDDGVACTSEDRCSGGICGGTPIGEGESCDDGSSCTYGERCLSDECSGGALPNDVADDSLVLVSSFASAAVGGVELREGGYRALVYGFGTIDLGTFANGDPASLESSEGVAVLVDYSDAGDFVSSRILLSTDGRLRVLGMVSSGADYLVTGTYTGTLVAHGFSETATVSGLPSDSNLENSYVARLPRDGGLPWIAMMETEQFAGQNFVATCDTAHRMVWAGTINSSASKALITGRTSAGVEWTSRGLPYGSAAGFALAFDEADSLRWEIDLAVDELGGENWLRGLSCASDGKAHIVTRTVGGAFVGVGEVSNVPLAFDGRSGVHLTAAANDGSVLAVERYSGFRQSDVGPVAVSSDDGTTYVLAYVGGPALVVEGIDPSTGAVLPGSETPLAATSSSDAMLIMPRTSGLVAETSVAFMLAPGDTTTWEFAHLSAEHGRVYVAGTARDYAVGSAIAHRPADVLLLAAFDSELKPRWAIPVSTTSYGDSMVVRAAAGPGAIIGGRVYGPAIQIGNHVTHTTGATVPAYVSTGFVGVIGSQGGIECEQ